MMFNIEGDCMDFKNEIKKFERLCYKPIVKEFEDKNYSGSKYYGNVWIADNDSWPINNIGVYLTFVYQLDIATLPELYKNKLGGKGVLQFFYDMSSYGEDGEYVRIVYPDEKGKYHQQPLNDDEDNYVLDDGEAPVQKIITEWKEFIDYPLTSEEFEDDMEMLNLWEKIEEHEDYDDDKYSVISGDKLGGYALFAQAGYNSSDLIYQIDFFTEEEEGVGRCFNSYAPSLIAADGTALLFYHEDEKEFSFDWACG